MISFTTMTQEEKKKEIAEATARQKYLFENKKKIQMTGGKGEEAMAATSKGVAYSTAATNFTLFKIECINKYSTALGDEEKSLYIDT